MTRPETPAQVMYALIATLPLDQRLEWERRWETAETYERDLRAKNRAWDESLLGVTRFGQ